MRTQLRQVKETLVKSAKRRAQERGYSFDISIGTLVWPEVCPALGIPLDYAHSPRVADNHPSLDQIVPRAGYTHGNVRVISRRANQVKGNATALELFLVAHYVAAELGLQLFVANDTVQAPPFRNTTGVSHMSELKTIALQHAVAVTKTPDEALAAAKKFHAFLTGGADAPARPAAGAAAAGKPATPGKAATGKPATLKGQAPEEKAAARLAAREAARAAAEDADPEADATDGPTKQEVGEAIKALMAAGMRPQAKELLAEYGAEALSGIPEENYAEFIEKANDLLVAA